VEKVGAKVEFCEEDRGYVLTLLAFDSHLVDDPCIMVGAWQATKKEIGCEEGVRAPTVSNASPM
jgi:hypothetical protein